MTAAAGPDSLRLLLVEDNPGDARLVAELIRDVEQGSVTVHHVTRLSEALSALEEEDFDAVLLDLALPDAVGVAIVQRIRTSSPYAPIVVLSGGDESRAIEAVHAGAEDYVAKLDISGLRLMRAVRYAIERHARMHRIAYYDGLTHLPNRTLFRDCLARTVMHSRRAGDLCAVLFVDLDGFKRINDTLGHDAGDDVLRGVARRMRATLRANDVAARYGGDEFAVLLPALRDATEAVVVAELVREAIATPTAIGAAPSTVGASIGIAMFPRDGNDADALLQRADAAMYANKQARAAAAA